MSYPTYFLVLLSFFLVAYLYDKVIDKEIKNNQRLEVRLLKLKYFNSMLFSKAAYYSLLFKYWGVSRNLNIVGSIFSLYIYSFLIYVVYYFYNVKS
jgi:hypothetical protein